MKIIFFLIVYCYSLLFGPGEKEPGKDFKKYQKGMVVNLESDYKGCGWVIEIEGKQFKPKNLSKSFKKDNLVIKLDYEKSLTLFKCTSNKKSYQEIYINWMEISK